MSAHTPGIFRVEVLGSPQDIRKQTLAIYSDVGKRTDIAATVVSAAPDLLAALKLISDAFAGSNYFAAENALIDAAAAIAKAEGR